MMTKKDYQKFAELLKNYYYSYHTEIDDEKFVSFTRLKWDLIDILRKDNPRFNENKFLKAVEG